MLDIVNSLEFLYFATRNAIIWQGWLTVAYHVHPTVVPVFIGHRYRCGCYRHFHALLIWSPSRCLRRSYLRVPVFDYSLRFCNDPDVTNFVEPESIVPNTWLNCFTQKQRGWGLAGEACTFQFKANNSLAIKFCMIDLELEVWVRQLCYIYIICCVRRASMLHYLGVPAQCTDKLTTTGI